MDKTSSQTLKFILEQLSQILPHAKNIHIVDVAMAWTRPLFKTPKPSNAEVSAPVDCHYTDPNPSFVILGDSAMRFTSTRSAFA
jgi:hypothetical protein